jgi:hypothetical protein
MPVHCQHPASTGKAASTPRYQRILWTMLIINLTMFGFDVGAGFESGSASLLAATIEFLSDAANDGVLLAVLACGALMRAALGVAGSTGAWPDLPVSSDTAELATSAAAETRQAKFS